MYVCASRRTVAHSAHMEAAQPHICFFYSRSPEVSFPPLHPSYPDPLLLTYRCHICCKTCLHYEICAHGSTLLWSISPTSSTPLPILVTVLPIPRGEPAAPKPLPPRPTLSPPIHVPIQEQNIDRMILPLLHLPLESIHMSNVVCLLNTLCMLRH